MRVAVIGTWHVHTTEYAEAIKSNPKSELACVWDKDPIKGKEFADKMGVPFVENLDDILNDATIDSVQITTATTEHRDIMIACANAGKNIFTEKVIATTNEEAEEIVDAIKKANKKFTISYPHKTFPTVRAAKKIMDDGKLGKVTYARVRNVHNGSSAGWLPDTFYDAAQTGGGAMMDLGAHPMYLLGWFFGNPKSIVSVFTNVDNHPVEDNAVSVFEFADGVIGVSETGFVSDGNPYVIEISGTEGAVMVHNNMVEYANRAETEGKLVPYTELPAEMPLPIHQWIDAVVDGTDAPYGTDEALLLTKFMVGAYKAYETGSKYTF